MGTEPLIYDHSILFIRTCIRYQGLISHNTMQYVVGYRRIACPNTVRQVPVKATYLFCTVYLTSIEAVFLLRRPFDMLFDWI